MHAGGGDLRLLRIEFILDFPVLLRDRVQAFHLNGSKGVARLGIGHLPMHQQIVAGIQQPRHQDYGDGGTFRNERRGAQGLRFPISKVAGVRRAEAVIC